MPQLKIETFVTQYFWLIVILFVFYFIIYTYVIPRMTSLELTRQRLQSEESSNASNALTSSSFDLKILNTIPAKNIKNFDHIVHDWAKKVALAYSSVW